MASSVFELRQYTLHPGRRDDLIDLFERRFVEPQEEVGMRLIGTFRDLDDPDRFVWIRGFADLATRRDALGAFYGGPVWRANRDAANATMIDSDDVLLLRPAGTGPALPEFGPRPPAAVEMPVPSLVSVVVYLLAPEADATGDTSGEAVDGTSGGASEFLDGEVRPALQRILGVPIYALRTESAENNFPALPVREGENAYVLLAAFPDEDAHNSAYARLASDPAWSDGLAARLDELAIGPIQRLRLRPTVRSALR